MDKAEKDTIKILCFQGLSSFKSTEFDDENRYNFGATILSAFLAAIGEDFKSNVNEHAFSGLTKLLSTAGTLSEKDVHRSMSDLVAKLRPFIDCGSHRESASAIECFAAVSKFATDSYKGIKMK